MTAVLKEGRDPDWQWFPSLAHGMDIGTEGLPRTPAVFEAKTKWRLEEDVGPGFSATTNYQSCEGYEKRIEEQFEAEAQKGWMRKYTNAEAEALFGTRLLVASLGSSSRAPRSA